MTERNAMGQERTAWQQKIYDLQVELGIGAEEGLFCCEHFEECNGSVPCGIDRKGDWAYVGRQYGDAPVGGKLARVLFVAMDRPFRGRESESPFLEYWSTQEDWKRSAFRPSPKNAHMVGVNRTMKHLLDDGAIAEDRCEQFALVNAVLCGPRAAKGRSEEGLMKSQSSTRMRSNCRNHINRFIQELEPDIVITQGKNPRADVASLVVVERKHVGRWTNGRSGRAHRWVELSSGAVEGGKTALFLLMNHPSRYPGFSGYSERLPDEWMRALERAAKEHSERAD